MTKAKPPIDKAAELAEVPPHPTQGAVPQAETSLSDVAENHPGYYYKPKQGVVSTDVLEVALMLMFQMVAPNVNIQAGALRAQIMTGERFGWLSPEAQKHMEPVPSQG